MEPKNLSFIYKAPYEKVFNEVKNALSDCKFKVKEADEKSGKIKASSGASILSWGQQIDLLVSKIKNGTKVEVQSSPKFQLYDWGKGKMDANSFFVALNKRVK